MVSTNRAPDPFGGPNDLVVDPPMIPARGIVPPSPEAPTGASTTAVGYPTPEPPMTRTDGRDPTEVTVVRDCARTSGTPGPANTSDAATRHAAIDARRGSPDATLTRAFDIDRSPTRLARSLSIRPGPVTGSPQFYFGCTGGVGRETRAPGIFTLTMARRDLIWFHGAVGMLAALALSLPACSGAGFGGRSSGARVVSLENSVMLTPKFRSRAYRSQDRNTADVFLTDLAPESLSAPLLNPADAAGLNGQIVHIHMFVQPKPGRTPIESTAVTATIRYVVLARGEVGVYAGGGFLMPKGKPGGGSFAGRMEKATLRLENATPGFENLLGPAEITVTFKAPRDEEFAGLIDARIEDLIDRALFER